MDRKHLVAILAPIYVGAVFIGSAIVNAYLNLHSTPPLMQGLIYELLAFGLIGVAFIALGLRGYVRASREVIR